jgi:hypothetical protein
MFDRTHGTTPLADFDVISINDDMTGFPGFGISGAPPNDILLDVASSRGRDFVFLHAVANANLTHWAPGRNPTTIFPPGTRNILKGGRDQG